MIGSAGLLTVSQGLGHLPHSGQPLGPPSWATSTPHILRPILAGLLRGQLPDQQGPQELAHEAEVLVEGVEGFLGDGSK